MAGPSGPALGPGCRPPPESPFRPGVNGHVLACPAGRVTISSIRAERRFLHVADLGRAAARAWRSDRGARTALAGPRLALQHWPRRSGRTRLQRSAPGQALAELRPGVRPAAACRRPGRRRGWRRARPRPRRGWRSGWSGLAGQLDHAGQELAPREQVQPRRRLVEDQHFRIDRQGQGQADLGVAALGQRLEPASRSSRTLGQSW